MEERTLRKSGLKVSAVGLGCNNFGGRVDFAATQKVVHKAFEIGVTLSEEDQLDPEQSTSAIVVHHPQAKYFSV